MFELILLGVFAFAGLTSYQFFRGRKENLLLMRDFVRELEDALKPLDKTYTLLGLYSGFKAEYLVKAKNVEKVEASLGLMPREAPLYYPISLLTMRHDRLYMVFRLKKRPPKVHIIKKKALSYTGTDVPPEKMEKVEMHGEEYLVYCEDERACELAKSLVMNSNVLHVALTPETKVLYVFAKPKRGEVKELARRALEAAEVLREL